MSETYSEARTIVRAVPEDILGDIVRRHTPIPLGTTLGRAEMLAILSLGLFSVDTHAVIRDLRAWYVNYGKGGAK